MDSDDVIVITVEDLMAQPEPSTASYTSAPQQPPIQQPAPQQVQIPIAPPAFAPVPYVGTGVAGQGPPMPPAPYGMQPQMAGDPGADSSSNWKMVVVVGLTMALVGVGAFFAGQSTRQSDEQVTARIQTAVAAEHSRGQKQVDAADRRTRRAVRSANSRMRRAQAQNSMAVNNSWSNGHSAGFAEGKSQMCEEIQSSPFPVYCSNNVISGPGN